MSRSLYPAKVVRDPDGTTLICVSRRDVPLVAMGIDCGGGHRCNPRGLSQEGNTVDRPGLANLAAALLSEGPVGTVPLEWHRQLDARAISFGIDATATQWGMSLQCLSEEVDHAVSMAQDCLIHPGMPRSEWKRFVKSYRAGAKEQWAQPMNVVGPALNIQVLGYGHPSAHPAFERSYRRASYREAYDLAKGAFCRGPGTCAVVGGDMEAEKGFDHLRALMADLPTARGPVNPEELGTFPSKAPTWVLDNPKVDQAFIALGRPGVRSGDPDRVALRLANYMLGGGGFSSRLMARARSGMGHTYGIHSVLGEERILTLFAIQTFTKLENLAAMHDLICEELDLLCREGFRPDELKDAQDHFHGAVPLGLTAPGDILGAVASGLRAGLTIEDLQADWNRIRNTTLDDANRAVRRLVGDASFHLTTIGPAAKLLPQLKSRGEALVFPFRSRPDSWHD